MKPDDSSLDPDDLRAVEQRARDLLHRADAWDRYPTNIEDILEAAELTVAPTSLFDPQAILAYLKGKAAHTAQTLKSAIGKILGLYDGAENVIHIDDTVGQSKQRFLKLHEAGHHEIPTHRKMFRFFEDCEKNLSPEISDKFEREANNFARFALFQGDTYARHAADFPMEVKSPMKLASKFGASIYASAREFARTNHRACAVYVLEPIEYVEGVGARAQVRRIEVSPSFRMQFGRPADRAIDLDHALGRSLPIGRKMTQARSVQMRDLNGQRHECLAEAFDTTHNIVILLYPLKALETSVLIVPAKATKPLRTGSLF